MSKIYFRAIKFSSSESIYKLKFLKIYFSPFLRTQRDADKKDFKVRIKHTKEWRDELERLFQNKALNDILQKENEKTALLETENTIRIRRSASIGPNSGLSNTRNVLVISFLAIFGLIRFKRTFMASIRLFLK